MKTSSNWLVPVATGILAVALSVHAGMPMYAGSLRAAQATTPKTCHRSVATAGQALHVWNLDGRTTNMAPQDNCAAAPPGFTPTADEFKTVDCRQKHGGYYVSSESYGRVARPSAAPAGLSSNSVKKELLLLRTPAGAADCCETFSASGRGHMDFTWFIVKFGPGPAMGNEGRVLMNDPGHPRGQVTRTEWVDCTGVPRFRERTVIPFLEAEIAWNAAGRVILNKSVLRIAEFFETDQMRRRQMFRAHIVRGSGNLGSETYEVSDSHPDGWDLRNEFRGGAEGDAAASVRFSGSMLVVAEAPQGRWVRPLQRSTAFGSYHFRDLDLRLKDDTENIVVPDP